MKVYACPHCGREVVVHSATSWNHEHPACAQFTDFKNGGWDGFAERAAKAFGDETDFPREI